MPNITGNIPSEVFAAFNLLPVSIEKTNRIYKVSCDRGVFALKKVEPDRKKLWFITSVIQYLRSQGLAAAVPYVLTFSGEPFFIKDNLGYVLSRWIEGRQLDFSSTDDLLKAAALMADMHQKGEGYAAKGADRWRNRLGSWLPLWVREREDLEQCHLYDSELSNLLSQADLALKLLRQGGIYEQEVILASRKGTVCHRDLVYHNFLSDSQGDLHIIDFEYCAVELPVADLGRFMRKALPMHHWDWQLVQQLLQTYQAQYPLSPGGIQLLRAYLTFPHEWWRLASRLVSGAATEEEIAKRVEHMKKKDSGRAELLEKMAAAL